jgi:histidyl-tRNA synthetase
MNTDKKIGKALEFANKSDIPFVAIVGKKELESQSITLREMSSGKETSIKIDEAADKLKEIARQR